MGVFLRSTHIVLGFSLIAGLLLVAIDLLMHRQYAEAGLCLAIADMYSYFLYVIIAGRDWPWESAVRPGLNGEDVRADEHPGLAASNSSVLVD